MSDTPYAGRFQDVLAEDRSAETRRRSSSRRRGGRSRLRVLYFGLAALWGYAVGAAGILGGFALRGTPFRAEPVALALLAVAGGLAVIGGVVAAKAYREVVGRRGGR